MKICLIIPPSIFLLDERVFMTLGILKVAAVLERSGASVDVIDLSGIQNYESAIEDYCLNSETIIFGITATTPQLPATIKILKTIKAVKSDAKVILGGPHITLVNAAYKRERKLDINGRATLAFKQLESSFDILVAGDGEEAIFEALKDDPPKLIDADIPKSSLFLTNKKLTENPFPARHLVDVASYHYKIDEVSALSMIAQLGCPFECGFCGGRASPFLRKVRTRTSENIVAEILHIYHTYGIRGFMMYDDELNVNKKMIELMNMIAEAQTRLNTEFRLRGFIKAELFTDEQAEAMYRAGFRWILTGFESGSPKILENINKKASQEDNTRCIEIARKHGLKIKALMSIGHPGESNETVMETRDWLLNVRPDDFDVTIITTYPGTPYYDYAVPHRDKPGIWIYTYEKSGDRLYSIEIDYAKIADYYKGDPDGGYQSFVYTDYLTPKELVDLRHTKIHTINPNFKVWDFYLIK
ncbi:MAG: B12-binding domain-containing radical SAM protein [Candidatus Yanofskybacteria bacterium]|nr:B12-binding domain-containing radical SAM protein [Candidatus Yanofskybacteria bacterium]